MKKLWIAAALALAASGGGGAAQEQERAGEFSSRVQLVEVYATVTDAKGEPVTGLERDDFEVLEDNQRQDVSTFAAGEFPLTVALGVDRSWSMAGDRLRLAKQASQSFLRELKPDDRSMVVAISSEAEVIAPLSTDRFTQVARNRRARSVEHHGAARRDHRDARSPRARAGPPGADRVLRRCRSLQHGDRRGRDRARAPQQRADLSDCVRPGAAAAARRARRP